MNAFKYIKIGLDLLPSVLEIFSKNKKWVPCPVCTDTQLPKEECKTCNNERLIHRRKGIPPSVFNKK